MVRRESRKPDVRLILGAATALLVFLAPGGWSFGAEAAATCCDGRTGTFYVRYKARTLDTVRPTVNVAPLQKDGKEALLATDMGDRIEVNTGALRAFFATRKWQR